MKRHYFLGLAAGHKHSFKQIFAIGTKRDLSKLKVFLNQKYQGETVLCKNGRGALALALKAYFDKGDKILVNGFTCYAVYEAVKAAGLEPVFVDISKEDLNMRGEAVAAMCSSEHEDLARAARSVSGGHAAATASPRGVIIQNSFGNTIDMKKMEKFAREHNLTIIEDLAHSAGRFYPDGREVGTVGAATALSFGKDKAIDTISGGAVVFRAPKKHEIKAPRKAPKISDSARARFYPMFGALVRGLAHVHLGGVLMRFLVRIHFVEKSADNKLDLSRRIAKFEAKLALKQLENLKETSKKPIRDFYLVENRTEVLRELKKNGYHFDGFWYERPISPERYYEKVHFPENECPVAVEVSQKIINFPNYYPKKDLEKALKIVKPYLAKGGQDG